MWVLCNCNLNVVSFLKMGGLLGFIKSWWMFLTVYPSFAMIMAHQKITILQPLYTEWWFLKMRWDRNLSPPSGKGSKFFSKIGICWNAVDGSFWTGEKKNQPRGCTRTWWMGFLQPSSTMVSWTTKLWMGRPKSLPSWEALPCRVYLEAAHWRCEKQISHRELMGEQP